MAIFVTLEKGLPANVTERDPRERRCYAFLDRLGVSYRRADHEAAATMELCREIEKSLGCPICKNLLLTTIQAIFHRGLDENVQTIGIAIHSEEG